MSYIVLHKAKLQKLEKGVADLHICTLPLKVEFEKHKNIKVLAVLYTLFALAISVFL